MNDAIPLATNEDVLEYIERTFANNNYLFASFKCINSHTNVGYIYMWEKLNHRYIFRRHFLQMLTNYLEAIPNCSYSVSSTTDKNDYDRSEEFIVSITRYTATLNPLQLK